MDDGRRYNPITGEIVHEPGVTGGERLDHYLERRLPGRDWYAACDAGLVQVRDKLNMNTNTYTGEWWYLTYFDADGWKSIDLEPGERPRMKDGFCCIVRE